MMSKKSELINVHELIIAIKQMITERRWIFGCFFAVQLATLAAVFFHR